MLSGAETRKEKMLVDTAMKIIAALAIVGVTCSVLAGGHLGPLLVMAAVAWVVWQVGGAFAGG